MVRYNPLIFIALKFKLISLSFGGNSCSDRFVEYKYNGLLELQILLGTVLAIVY